MKKRRQVRQQTSLACLCITIWSVFQSGFSCTVFGCVCLAIKVFSPLVFSAFLLFLVTKFLIFNNEEVFIKCSMWISSRVNYNSQDTSNMLFYACLYHDSQDCQGITLIHVSYTAKIKCQMYMITWVYICIYICVYNNYYI
jgi:hypothetical protein